MRTARAVSCGLAVLALAGVAAADGWVISGPVVITTPMEIGDVVVVGGGSLTVRDVPDPGLTVRGNIFAVGSGEVRLERSVVQVLSTYNGQYALVGVDEASITVTGCEYRVPSGVQHALYVAGDARLEVEDTEFEFIQLLAAGRALLRAARLDGQFEVILQGDARIELSDIPHTPGNGELWLWPEFPSGSVAAYTPPMPGFIASWTFPPPGSSGIPQSALIERCQVKLWPLLVREGCDLTLREIPDGNWVIVGLHLPSSLVISGLANGLSAHGEPLTLDLPDRTIRLDNASVDTWNLYPENNARVRVLDSRLGEVLTTDSSIALLERTVVDGSGGFVGAGGSSLIVATRCAFTCTIQAAQDGTVRLHDSLVQPYPADPTGAWTRFGAYDQGRLLADQTAVFTTPELGADGLIGVTSLVDAPASPPGPAAPVILVGTAALYSLAGGPGLDRWQVQAVAHDTHGLRLLAVGEGNVEHGSLGTWEGADPTRDYELQIVLTDSWGRSLVGRRRVPATTFPPGSAAPTGR